MHAMKRLFAFLVALPLVLFGCSTQTPEPPEPPRMASFEASIGTKLAQDAAEYAEKSTELCLGKWFESYVASRKVVVLIGDREPTTFGPWTAAKEYGTTDAKDDGSLTEWADNYYITHDWSEIGQQILSLVPGDVVTVNGRQARVTEVFNYPKDSYYDEIMQLSGKKGIVLQTCYPESDYNRIVFAST